MRLDSFKLKLILMVLMVLDHIHQFIPHAPEWFTMLGRLVAPVFCYLVVEGFFYTRSRKKYLIRLLGWGAFMFAGSKLVMFMFQRESHITNNIFLSFAVSVALMSIIEWTKSTKKYALGVIGAIVVSAVSMFTEASIYGLGMTLVFYFFRNKKLKMSIAYIIMSLVLTIGLGLGSTNTISELLIFDLQWMMVFALPLILMYNGQRGLNTKFSKYMFYAFYPFHIWILYIIGYLITTK